MNSFWETYSSVNKQCVGREVCTAHILNTIKCFVLLCGSFYLKSKADKKKINKTFIS